MARVPHSILDHCNADAPFLTEFRRLLYRVKNLPDKRELKTLLVTSAILSEGKSTVCAILAIAAAQKGMRTMLVDCDLRRPTIHRLFNLPREGGVCDLLVEGKTIKSVTKKTALDKLDIVTAGRTGFSVSDILDPVAIGSVLTDSKFYYDLIVVDSPPVIPVSDPMLLASKVDGVLLVIKAGSTQREVVARATEIMSTNGSNLLGTVLNNLSGTLPDYYDYHHYAYDYKSDADSSKSRSSQTGGSRVGPADAGARSSKKSADKKSLSK